MNKMTKLNVMLAILSLEAIGTQAFSPSVRNFSTHGTALLATKKEIHSINKFDPFDIDSLPKPSITESAEDGHGKSFNAKVAAISIVATVSPSVANAAGPDWGIFEGRTGSLLHPVMMAGLLVFSLYTGFLEFQWSRQREIGEEINSLKKGMPKISGFSSLSDAISGAEEGTDVSALKAALPVEKLIAELTADRKELASQGNRDKHFSQGALLAFLGTAFAIEGPLNTYARAGKLFPGPHLYAGAGLVVLWAAAAACVPAMQKGNDTARSIHIGANALGVGLFGWQVVSGLPILFKVIEKTKWP